MTDFPNPTTFLAAGSERTEGEARSFFEAWMAATKQLPGANASSELTIASGAITPTAASHTVDTEANAASDDLTTIVADNLPAGSWLILKAEHTARTVVVKHNAGGAGGIHLATGVDYSLDDTEKRLVLERVGADWYEITRGSAADSPIVASLLTTRGDIITRGASAPQRLALGASGRVLQSDGTDAVWGTLVAGAFATGPGIVSLPMLNNAAALTLVGNATNGSAVRTDIAAANDGDVMRRSGTGIGFGSIIGAKVTNGSGVSGTTVNDALDTLSASIASTAAGVAKRGTVRAATTANITISTALNNADTLDGVTLATGDLVLVKNQSAPAENGVYVVGVTPVRAAEFDTYNEHPGSNVIVQEGTANADLWFYCTSNAGGTLGSTAITYIAVTLVGPTTVSLEALSLVNGDLIYATGADTLARRAIGSTADYLQVVGGVPTWVARPTLESLEGLSLVSGDILYGTAADTLARLAKGTDGQALILASGLPAWATRREVLTANRTYYVRTDGSNSNDGLTNTSGGAFLTLQKAIDVVAALDISTFAVTIQVGAGTYTGGVTVTGPWTGAGSVSLLGDTTTPANVIISTTGSNCVSVSNYGRLRVRGFEFRTTTSGQCLSATTGGYILVDGAVRFGACAGIQVLGDQFGFVEITSNYTISGGGLVHWQASGYGMVRALALTITTAGTPAFSSVFANADDGVISCFSNTFSGTGATGQRFIASNMGYINTNGGGASYLPGSVAGSGTNPSASPYGRYV